jgi:hypothetical protein
MNDNFAKKQKPHDNLRGFFCRLHIHLREGEKNPLTNYCHPKTRSPLHTNFRQLHVRRINHKIAIW